MPRSSGSEMEERTTERDNMATSAMINVRNRRKETGFCSIVFLRSVLIVFNSIFWLTGLAFLGLGIWAVITRHNYVGLLGNNAYSATTFLFLSVGVLIIVVGFLGCMAALHLSRCCLITFAFLLLFVFILEAITGVLAYLFENTIREELTRNLNRTLTESYTYDVSITKSADNMQEDFQCCGANDYTDWRYSSWVAKEKPGSKERMKVPDSCCISPSMGCGINNHPSNIFHQGCLHQLEQFLRSHLIIIGGVALGLCCLQVFGIIFACCLASKVKDPTGFL